MLAWRIAKKVYALDRVGMGARLVGGRWNSAGVAVVYAGLSPEIASLEKLVHTSDFLPIDLVLVEMNLPVQVSLYQKFTIGDLPVGWDSLPSSAAAQVIGDSFVKEGRYLGMVVPSVIMPEANNIVLNPNHPKFKSVTMKIIRSFEFDSRLTR